jgi:hypothetical protein
MVPGGNEQIESEAEDDDGDPRYYAWAPPIDDVIVVKGRDGRW